RSPRGDRRAEGRSPAPGDEHVPVEPSPPGRHGGDAGEADGPGGPLRSGGVSGALPRHRHGRDGPPFLAVIGRIRAAAHNWRNIRAKLSLGGLPDPLNSLTSLHAVLDLIEYMAVEAKVNEGGDALQKFYYE